MFNDVADLLAQTADRFELDPSNAPDLTELYLLGSATKARRSNVLNGECSEQSKQSSSTSMETFTNRLTKGQSKADALEPSKSADKLAEVVHRSSTKAKQTLPQKKLVSVAEPTQNLAEKTLKPDEGSMKMDTDKSDDGSDSSDSDSSDEDGSSGSNSSDGSDSSGSSSDDEDDSADEAPGKREVVEAKATGSKVSSEADRASNSLGSTRADDSTEKNTNEKLLDPATELSKAEAAANESSANVVKPNSTLAKDSLSSSDSSSSPSSDDSSEEDDNKNEILSRSDDFEKHTSSIGSSSTSKVVEIPKEKKRAVATNATDISAKKSKITTVSQIFDSLFAVISR